MWSLLRLRPSMLRPTLRAAPSVAFRGGSSSRKEKKSIKITNRSVGPLIWRVGHSRNTTVWSITSARQTGHLQHPGAANREKQASHTTMCLHGSSTTLDRLTVQQMHWWRVSWCWCMSSMASCTSCRLSSSLSRSAESSSDVRSRSPSPRNCWSCPFTPLLSFWRRRMRALQAKMRDAGAVMSPDEAFTLASSILIFSSAAWAPSAVVSTSKRIDALSSTFGSMCMAQNPDAPESTRESTVVVSSVLTPYIPTSCSLITTRAAPPPSSTSTVKVRSLSTSRRVLRRETCCPTTTARHGRVASCTGAVSQEGGKRSGDTSLDVLCPREVSAVLEAVKELSAVVLVLVLLAGSGSVRGVSTGASFFAFLVFFAAAFRGSRASFLTFWFPRLAPPAVVGFAEEVGGEGGGRGAAGALAVPFRPRGLLMEGRNRKGSLSVAVFGTRSPRGQRSPFAFFAL
eukprot:Sspe_Gene.66104::Locus_39078_Transcript_1_1_Confidence_1.000_Length_1540::g.66104::m.66104